MPGPIRRIHDKPNPTDSEFAARSGTFTDSNAAAEALAAVRSDPNDPGRVPRR